MSMCYDKLFLLMKEKGLTTYRIRQEKIITETLCSVCAEAKASPPIPSAPCAGRWNVSPET